MAIEFIDSSTGNLIIKSHGEQPVPRIGEVVSFVDKLYEAEKNYEVIGSTWKYSSKANLIKVLVYLRFMH